MPYEEISAVKYADMIADLKPLTFGQIHNEFVEHEPGCEAGACEIGARK
jgi:hypothetical protein